ncbi:MAG TPA: LuxR C-terminal-related transcriptional regulator [Bauldia sp.]|nr:LuxR C-terminal-related transcriptional regulator [Bauldia sp.]
MTFTETRDLLNCLLDRAMQMSKSTGRHPEATVASIGKSLQSGHEAYLRRDWADAYRLLSRADATAPLGAENLQMLAEAAYLIGHVDEYLRALDRAYHGYLHRGECLRAARCAFWIGLCLLLQGETGPATGWSGRARRLIERNGPDCVERGYLRLPLAEQSLMAADSQAAYDTAVSAVEIGERFGEPDLIACARHLQGRSLILQGRVTEGLALLDEAMVAVVAGELSPIMTGLIYCSVIDSCQQIYAFGRAREWTSALARWCADQPQLANFTGICRVRRAEILQLQGAWPDAIEEARLACGQFSEQAKHLVGAGFYQQAEVQRLRGDFEAAEEAYQAASGRGYEPQPGLALLRLAQGRADIAAAAIRRVVASAKTDQLQRTRLLPAYVEIVLTMGAIEEAQSACRELDELARTYDTEVLRAIADQSRGAVKLVEGNAGAALELLRSAFHVWEQVEAPYPAARARELIGLACRALGDMDGAGLELEAARVAFERLGAVPDLARVDALKKRSSPAQLHGLTRRELQVLRLIAAGKTNKVIAAKLFVSQRTVDRHVSNLFGKLNVPSRTAATSYAYTHKLI